jgi:hypothetical protein
MSPSRAQEKESKIGFELDPDAENSAGECDPACEAFAPSSRAGQGVDSPEG